MSVYDQLVDIDEFGGGVESSSGYGPQNEPLWSFRNIPITLFGHELAINVTFSYRIEIGEGQIVVIDPAVNRFWLLFPPAAEIVASWVNDDYTLFPFSSLTPPFLCVPKPTLRLPSEP